MKQLLCVLATLTCGAVLSGQGLTYPTTRTVDHVDVYHGTKVPDPYRWLEDDTSAETAKWVEAQNRVTFAYLDQIPYRAQLNQRLNALYNYAKFSAPSRRGEYYFFSKNDGLQNQSDGNNPTLMYGYGGFNIATTPGFNSLRVALLEQGFVYANVNMRGGSEYGEAWHDAGTKLKKQNVFDDFIAAAEWLVANKYTNPSKLAAQGGSNGGLLVGAVINQRPDLFRAAIPQVGVMDMLRFHKFTIGWNWIADYGSSDQPDEFKAIYAFIMHNLGVTPKF